MKENYTHIVVVLDSSGSMATIFDDTVAGFNHFLKSQKEAPGEATMTFIEFAKGKLVDGFGRLVGPVFGSIQNSKPFDKFYNPIRLDVDMKLDFIPVENVRELDKTTYVPNGGTPLLDTIGETIVPTGKSLAALPESLRPSKVLFVIITDGEENASRYYDLKTIKEMTTHQTDVYKWEFVYLGANQDAIAVGTSFGIRAGSIISYGVSAQEIGSTYGVLSSKTTAFRSAKTADEISASLNFTEEERKSAKNN